MLTTGSGVLIKFALLALMKVAQFRPCQGGIGSTGVMVATSTGSTTVGVQLRLCTDADGIPIFCPFSSNLIGGPMMMWSAMFVSRIAFMSPARPSIPTA